MENTLFTINTIQLIQFLKWQKMIKLKTQKIIDSILHINKIYFSMLKLIRKALVLEFARRSRKVADNVYAAWRSGKLKIRNYPLETMPKSTRPTSSKPNARILQTAVVRSFFFY